jgi:tRNA/tmRNA/rRNA uracil-C5-methylase (TrmA/RlmC/RlmD family)
VWNAGAVTDQLIELEIERVAHGGVFVARHEGRVVFVSGALPGERVIAQVTEDSAKSYWRAEVAQVLTATGKYESQNWMDPVPDPAEFTAKVEDVMQRYAQTMKRLA